MVRSHKLLKVTCRVASSARYIAVVTMDDVRHVIHLALHRNPPVAVTTKWHYVSRLTDNTSEDIRRIYDGLSLLEESFGT